MTRQVWALGERSHCDAYESQAQKRMALNSVRAHLVDENRMCLWCDTDLNRYNGSLILTQLEEFFLHIT